MGLDNLEKTQSARGELADNGMGPE